MKAFLIIFLIMLPQVVFAITITWFFWIGFGLMALAIVWYFIDKVWVYR